MIEMRKISRTGDCVSSLGLGLGGIQKASPEEIEKTVAQAIKNGINFFDLCAGGSCVYEPFGKAIKDVRDKVYFQLHFGAVYNEDGDYGWSRDLEKVKSTFEWELKCLGTDYADYGFLHCVDEDKDIDDIISNGILDYVKQLKKSGAVRHLGFSSHTPSVAQKLLDMGIFDIMMFSINPAYDLEKGDEYGVGKTNERAELFRRCEKDKVAISVMKPFHAGKLLNESTSPFKKAMTKNQCIQYALDRPAVVSVVPGVRGIDDLNELLPFLTCTPEDNDYSLIAEFTPEDAVGNCVYCGHCKPCPVGIDIGLVNKYYDLSLVGDKMAHNHYSKLSVNADDCISCGHCDSRCPFSVHQSERMKTIANYFNKGE